MSMGLAQANPLLELGNHTHPPPSKDECGHIILSPHKGLVINPSLVEGQTEAALQRSADFIQVLVGGGPRALFALTMSSGVSMS